MLNDFGKYLIRIFRIFDVKFRILIWVKVYYDCYMKLKIEKKWLLNIKKGNFVYINMIIIIDKNNYFFWNFDRFCCLICMIE